MLCLGSVDAYVPDAFPTAHAAQFDGVAVNDYGDRVDLAGNPSHR